MTQMTNLRGGLAASMILIALALPKPALSHQTREGCAAKPSSAIEHLVVVIQENHSFDTYFSDYCQAPMGSNPKCTDGPKCCEAGPKKDPVTGKPATVLDDMANGAFDPNHHRDCEEIEVDGGKMDKFTTKFAGKTKDNEACGDPRNFALADHKTIKPYWDLARQGALADRYFQPLIGASSGNDMYFARACFVFDDNEAVPPSSGSTCVGGPKANLQTYNGKTIGDLLFECDVDWSFYAEGYEEERAAEIAKTCPKAPADCRSGKADYPCLFDPSDVPFQYYASTRDRPDFMKDWTQFKKDIAAKKLPAVSFIKPLGYKTEHPGDKISISAGISFVQGVIKDVQSSPYAGNTLVLIAYDEGGGFYDHIAPPSPSKIDHQPYGVRVPLIAVGPFARKGQVSHVQMEHSSIVKFIEWNWLGGKTGQLGTRDTEVNNIGSLIDAKKAKAEVPAN